MLIAGPIAAEYPLFGSKLFCILRIVFPQSCQWCLAIHVNGSDSFVFGVKHQNRYTIGSGNTEVTFFLSNARIKLTVFLFYWYWEEPEKLVS